MILRAEDSIDQLSAVVADREHEIVRPASFRLFRPQFEMLNQLARENGVGRIDVLRSIITEWSRNRLNELE